MVNIPEIQLQWYYARFQSVGRAQSRYLLLLILISAYTVGLYYTRKAEVGVTFLEISDIPKGIVTACAVIVLEVMLLGVFGAFQAAREASDDLASRLEANTAGTKGAVLDTEPADRLEENRAETKWPMLDAQPNVADFMEYATFVHGKRTWLTPVGTMILYAVPVYPVVAWTFFLAWKGLTAACLDPSWLTFVYRGNLVLVVAVLAATLVFTRRRVKLVCDHFPRLKVICQRLKLIGEKE